MVTIPEIDRIVRNLNAKELSTDEKELLDGWLRLFDSDMFTAIAFVEKLKEAILQ